MKSRAAPVVACALLVTRAVHASDDASWRIADDPDYTPSTCVMDDGTNPFVAGRREARLAPDVSLVFGGALGPYGVLGAHEHDASSSSGRDVGFSWGADVEARPAGALDLSAMARRFDAASATEDTPTERTFFVASIGWRFHDDGMSWSPAKRGRNGVTPAYCKIHRKEIIPRLDVLRLVAHDDLRPALDGADVAFGSSVTFRWIEAAPHGHVTLDLVPGVFVVPASRRLGARLAALIVVDTLSFGPELWAVAPREVRATFDFGLRFEI